MAISLTAFQVTAFQNNAFQVEKLYLVNTTATGSNFGQLDEVAEPTLAATSTTASWTSAGSGSAIDPLNWASNTTLVAGDNNGPGVPSNASENGFRSQNPYFGTFGSDTWLLSFSLTGSNNVATIALTFNYNIYKSKNQDGSSATLLYTSTGSMTSFTQSTTTGVITDSITPGTLTFDNEYLFVTVSWKATSTIAGFTGSVTLNVGPDSWIQPGASFQPAVPGVTWLPNYPDFPGRAPQRLIEAAHQYHAGYVGPPFTGLEVGKVPWLPEYADFAGRTAPALTTAQISSCVFEENVQPIPQPTVELYQIQYIGSGTDGYPDFGVNPGVPSGVRAGDVLLLTISTSDNTVPSINQGYNLKFSTLPDTTHSLYVYWKIATASETAPTISGTFTSAAYSKITDWRGVDTSGSDPFDVIGTPSYKVASSSSAPVVSNSLNTTTPDTMVINLSSIAGDTGNVGSNGGTTPATNLAFSAGNANGQRVNQELDYLRKASIGATGVISLPIANGTLGTSISLLFALRSRAVNPEYTLFKSPPTVYPTAFIKPNTVPRINYAHPLAKNLIVCTVPEYKELVSNTIPTYGATSTKTIGINGLQVTNPNAPTINSANTGVTTLNLPANAPYYSLNNQSGASNIGHSILVWANVVNSVAADFSGICGTTSNGNDSGNTGLSFFLQNTTQQYADIIAGGQVGVTTGSSFFSTADNGTGPHLWAMSRGGGNYTFYKDGKLVTTTADANPSSPATAPTGQGYALCAQAPDGSSNITGSVSLLYMFNRALTAAEHTSLANDPLQLLDYGNDTSYFHGASATFNPSTGFGYEQSVDFTRSPLALPVSSQPYTAFVDWQPFVITFNPASGFPYEQSVDFARSAPSITTAQQSTGFLNWQPFVSTFSPSSNQSQPVYPDQVRGLRFPEASQQALAWAPEPDQNVRYFADSWIPSYPDFARGLVRSAEYSSVFETSLPDSSVRNFGTSWLPSFADFTKAVPRATEYPSFGHVELPSSNIGSFNLSWAPSYPDFARQSLRLQEYGYIAQVEEPNQNITNFNLSWVPTYPDFARKVSPLVDYGYSTRTVNQDASVRNFNLSWLPTYPDFARVPARSPEYIALSQTEQTDSSTRNFYSSWLPVYPDFVRQVSRTTDYTSITHVDEPNQNIGNFNLAWLPSYPDFTGRAQPRLLESSQSFISFTQLTDYTNNKATWLPEYPDFAGRSLPRLLEANQLAEIFVDWQPVASVLNPAVGFPYEQSVDFARTQTRTTEYPSFGQPRLPNASLVNFNISWLPAYPDFARAISRSVEYSSFGHIEQPSASIVAFGISWLPSYPDFVKSVARTVEYQSIFAVEESSSSIQFAGIDWLPTYPDFTRSLSRTSDFPAINQTDIPSESLRNFNISWLPVYPDFVRSPSRVVDYPSFGHIERNNQEVRNFNLSWLPEFADFARSVSVPVDKGGNYSTLLNFIAPPAPLGSWYPEYPDFARTVKPLVDLGYSFATRSPDSSVRNFNDSWLPSYPDFARGLAPLVDYGNYTRTTPQDSSVRNFNLSWLPIYPDFTKSVVRAPEYSSVFELLRDASSYINYQVSWLPNYPDFTRAAARAVEYPAVSEVLRKDQDVKPFSLSWLPEYPDFARQLKSTADYSGYSVYSEPPSVVNNYRLSWLPTYPDYYRQLKSTSDYSGIVVYTEPPSVVNKYSISWLPEYPDFARDNARTVEYRNFFNDPALPASISSYNLSWLPQYPDFAKAISRTVEYSSTFEDLVPSSLIKNFSDSWLPEYPDFARAAPRSAFFQSFFVGEPTSLINNYRLSWLPDYPDFAKSAPRAVEFPAQSQTFFKIVVPGIGWIPDYPDFARKAPVPTSIIEETYTPQALVPLDVRYVLKIPEMLQVTELTVRSFDIDFMDIFWKINPVTSSGDAKSHVIFDYDFYVLRSEAAMGPYQQIAGPFRDQYSLRDVQVYLNHKWRQYYYKIKIVHRPTGYSKTFGPATHAPEGDLIANEIIRQEDLLLREFTGRKCILLPARTFGPICTCYDNTIKRRTRSGHYPCYDTGWLGGYMSPVECYIQIDPSTTAPYLSAYHETMLNDTSARMISYPPVSPRDIIVEAENRRWKVTRVDSTQRLRSVVRQEIKLHEIPIGSLEYDIPININARSFEPSGVRNFTNPQNVEDDGNYDDILATFGKPKGTIK